MILLASNTLMSAPEIARMLLTDESHVRKVIHDFNRHGFESLRPRFRGGRPRRIPRTPVRAPKANAIAERFVRTARAECLDWLLILNRRHLERVLRVFVQHYNAHRPHRALELMPPDPEQPTPLTGSFRARDLTRRDRLGGLIHEYRLAA